jgi:hypothetical protein
MVFNLSLSPDAEARLRDRAQASGLTPEECARRIVEEAVSEHPPGETAVGSNGAPVDHRGTLPPEEISRRLEALRRFAGSVKVDWPVDDSRESIYGGEDDRGWRESDG